MSARCVASLVLFDLDGTLVDHEGAAAEAVGRWLVARGWADAGSLPGLVADWDAMAELHFTAYRQGRTTFQGQRRLRLRDFLPRVGIDAGGWSDERLDDTFRTYLAAYEAAWRAFPDAAPCLGALRQMTRVAVLSNGDQGQQEEKVCRTGLGPFVEVVLTSDQLGVAKPDPEVFVQACRQLGVSAQEVVYVGDRIEVDARAANAAGLRGIWLNRAGGEVQPGVEAIDDLWALPSLLTSVAG
jgi:putative hydrolase of the HAD superfamily